ncbi:MAG: flagellar brake protein [Calditerrivibrio sp.]|nr:flagellar brake protein [Calditerrivibrio sp.]MCA1980819.1 flagellar brake protein [Calditerrivibrio sp.]
MEKIKEYKNYIQVNTKINVTVNSGDYRGIYDSRIEDIRQDGIYVGIPTLKGVPFPIRPGMQVEVSFIASQGRFSFDTTVEGRVTDGIPMLKLKRPEFIYRSELRKYFRVDCRLKTKVFKIFYNISNNEVIAKLDSYDALIKDISGGGLRIQVEANFSVDDIVLLDLKDHFPGVNEIFGKIVTIFPSLNKMGEYGIEFISIRERDRDIIIKYVFKRQIEMKRLS